jgi:catechol 2,3-dioxygenase-like lactoylglutathione lyase family enzyme
MLENEAKAAMIHLRAGNTRRCEPEGDEMISRLGHVGIHVTDLARSRRFYEELLGLTVTDESLELQMVFLSARPEVEHHELLLCGGRESIGLEKTVQQISFRCDELGDIVEYLHRLRDAEVEIDMVVSHGNAIGIYFYDPDHNRCEVYWNSGLKARQPYLDDVDLDAPTEEILASLRESVRRYGEEGVINRDFLARQSLPS